MNNYELIKEIASSNSLYYFYLENSFFNNQECRIEKTPWRGDDSNNSLSFRGACLKQIFNLKDSFCGKHAQAIGGSGNEGRKIMTLHSSSLASLLCFYNLSKENALRIPGIDGIDFITSEFEKKNPVYKRGFTSNIDVALYSADNKAVCFLESKFSEYLSCGKKDNVSKDAYGDIYNIILSETQLGKKLKYNNECLASSEKGNHYCEGIKQMVSHYLGAVEYAKNNLDKDVFLGEILFKFSEPRIDKNIRGSRPIHNHFDDYKSLYENFVDAINELGDDFHLPNLHLLKSVLTYQDVFGNVDFIDSEVKQFYKL